VKKIQARHAETAQADQAQSKAGRAGLIIGIGLVILLIGGLIGGANFVATIGGIVFLVGLIMLIIALISG
jgi:formate/nitrite transporter FocA (FNT family)